MSRPFAPPRSAEPPVQAPSDQLHPRSVGAFAPPVPAPAPGPTAPPVPDGAAPSAPTPTAPAPSAGARAPDPWRILPQPCHPGEFERALATWRQGRWLGGAPGPLFRLLGGRRAPLRAWHLKLTCLRAHARWGWARTLRWGVLTPLRVAREAWELARAGRELPRAEDPLPAPVRALRLWLLTMTTGLRPRDHYFTGLRVRPRGVRAGDFVGQYEWRSAYALASALVPGARAARAQLSDKRRFEALAHAHGVAHFRTLAEYRDGGRVVPPPSAADELPWRDLFSKPANGSAGRGARRWRHLGDGRWDGGDGSPVDAAGVHAALARQSLADGPVLLQPCGRNHPALAPLSDGALCTVRVMTVRLPDAPPEPVGAVIRSPRPGAVVDNFDAGGFASAVELATGRLRRTIRQDERSRIFVCPSPHAGAGDAGLALPDWPACLALAVRAHALVPALPVAGWDVALTDEGPVLTEGNTFPCASLMQAASGEPFGPGRFSAALDAHLRRALAAGA